MTLTVPVITLAGLIMVTAFVLGHPPRGDRILLLPFSLLFTPPPFLSFKLSSLPSFIAFSSWVIFILPFRETFLFSF